MFARTSRTTRRGFLAVATAGLGTALIACSRAAAQVGVATATSAKAAPAPATPAKAAAAPVAGGAPAPAGRVPAPADNAAAAGEAATGDEPTVVFTDPSGQFSFQHPRSWGQSTQPGEVVRFTGRDEFISVAVVSTTAAPLDFARADAPALTKSSPGYSAGTLKAQKVAGKDGAMVSYTWQAGPSPVTGKLVPSSANRYYIPGPPGKMAVFTYSSPTHTYDPAGADDFANAFRWLK